MRKKGSLVDALVDLFLLGCAVRFCIWVIQSDKALLTACILVSLGLTLLAAVKHTKERR